MSTFTLQIGQTRNIVLTSSHVQTDEHLHPSMTSVGNATYITVKDAPAGTAISNTDYWHRAFEGGMLFHGNYDTSTVYYQHSAVFMNNNVYILKTGETAATGESPMSAASKWFMIFDSAVLVFDEDCVLYTDSSGVVEGLPISPGTLSFHGDELAFNVTTPPNTNALSVAKLADSGRTGYGNAFIGSDDKIYTAGYYSSNVRHNSRTTTHSATYRPLYEDVPHTGTWEGVVSSYYTLFAWTSTGECYAFGANNYGQLGLGDTVARYVLAKTSLTDIIGVCIGGGIGTSSTTYAWSDDSKFYSCGYNGYGQVGSGNTATVNAWHLNTVITSQVLKVSSTVYNKVHTLVMTDKSGDNLYGMGSNNYSQARGTTGGSATTPILMGKRATDIYAGGAYSSLGNTNIIDHNGDAWHVGYGSHGSAGNGGTANNTAWAQASNSPHDFLSIDGIDGFAGSRYATVNEAGKVWVWGYNGYGQLGMGSTAQQVVPLEVTIPTTGKIIKFSCMPNYNNSGAVCLTDNGEVYYAGYNGYYQSGNGNATQCTSWTKIPTGSVEIVDIMITGNSQYGTIHMLNDDGELLTTGYNSYGSCGLGGSLTQPMATCKSQL